MAQVFTGLGLKVGDLLFALGVFFQDSWGEGMLSDSRASVPDAVPSSSPNPPGGRPAPKTKLSYIFFFGVCVYVLGHERRGSLPTTCSRNFTRGFHAGGQSCEHSWLPNEEGYATADVESDQLHVPASWPPEAARLEKAGPLRQQD